MKNTLLFSIILLFVPLSGKKEILKFKPLVCINNHVITQEDLNQFLSLNLFFRKEDKTKIPQKIIKILEKQMLQQIIQKTIQNNIAQHLKLNIPDKDINDRIEIFCQNNNSDQQTFQKTLKEKGISWSFFKNFVKTEIVWGKIIENYIKPTVKIADIKKKADHLYEKNKNQSQEQIYHLGEIYLTNYNDTDLDGNSKKFEQILKELKAGTPFQELAQEYSQSASASRGGNLGWVPQQHLGEYKEAIIMMKPGMITHPIRTKNGIIIFCLFDKKSHEDLEEILFSFVEIISQDPIKLKEIRTSIKSDSENWTNYTKDIKTQVHNGTYDDFKDNKLPLCSLKQGDTSDSIKHDKEYSFYLCSYKGTKRTLLQKKSFNKAYEEELSLAIKKIYDQFYNRAYIHKYS